jgi:solute carrier family 25 (peroxisomal adenine nucleotide transporter), member 17
VTYPLITLSTRAQVDAKGEHRSITAALKKILDKEGVPGLYAALKSALFGIGMTNGIQYMDHAKQRNLLLLV